MVVSKVEFIKFQEELNTWAAEISDRIKTLEEQVTELKSGAAKPATTGPAKKKSTKDA